MKLEDLQIRRVLCALDVDRSGSTSLSMASLLAERFDASVDALYATPVVPRFDGQAAQVERLMNEHNAQERLSGILATVAPRVSVSPFVTRGDAAAVILTHSEQQGADLIVMASSPQRLFVGGPGTIAPVTALASCPVLTVGDRFKPAPLRRILLPMGATGVEPHAFSWISALALRFDAEVGVLRLGQPRRGLWQMFPATRVPGTGERAPANAEKADGLAALCAQGIDAYEIEHPGGCDSDAVSHLCESGAFDAAVIGLPTAEEGRNTDAWVGLVRLKTSAPVLSVRTPRSPVLFAPSHLDPLPKAVAGADWAQP